MRSIENSELYNLNRSTYINLRWIAFIGQIFAIFVVEFILEFILEIILENYSRIYSRIYSRKLF